MTKQPTEPLEEETSKTEQARDGANDSSNHSDGDHTVDDWSEKQIGFLAERVLSSAIEARKKTGEATALASPVDFAQASLGGLEDVASKSIRSAVRAGNRRKGCTLFGHDNENFMAEQKTK
jgi:hypothetical protein